MEKYILRPPDLKELVASSGKLATVPATVIDLLRVLHDATAPAGEVQVILERDPAMTANVLKIANSAIYGVRREISSVRDALVLLGNRRTATLAFATSMAPVLRKDLEGYGLTREQFWTHSLLSAAAAARVAERTGHREVQCESFTAGLVHDLGMLVLDPVLGAAKLALEHDGSRLAICHLEREALGYDHCQAGASLAESWGFPEMLCQAIGAHHDLEKQTDLRGHENWPVMQAVAGGNIIAQLVDEEFQGEFDGDPRRCLENLDLPGSLTEELRLDLTSNLSEICEAATALAPARV
jgi:HD-like signal output (HDOD) protein